MNYRIYKKGQNLLHWQIIVFFGIAVLILGLISNFLAYPANNIITIFENLSRTIQLFIPEQDLLQVPEGAWYLAITKFLGTIVTFMIVTQVIFQFFINQYQVWQLQRQQNHIVILGFGDCGQQFALTALAQHKQIIAIDLNISDQQYNLIMQNHKLSLLLADPTDKATLLQAAVHKAERVIFASNDNLLNIQAANSLREILQQQTNSKQTTAYIQIDDSKLIELLKETPHFPKEDKTLKVISFNRYQIAARHFLQTYPLYQYADLRGQDRIQVAIFGFTDKGQQILLQLVQHGYYRDLKTPHIIIIDPQATQRQQQFLNRYPGIDDPEICQLDFIEYDINTQTLDTTFLQTLEKQGKSAYGQNLTAILLCFEQDTQNITASLQLRLKTQQTRLALAPIFVEITKDSPALSVNIDKTPNFEQVIQHFGQLEQTCNWQQIVEANSDQLAKFLHKAYNARYGNDTKWEQLTETYRDANRGAADNLAIKLASLSYWIPEDPSNWSQKVDLTENQELLAKLEHRRWYAERRLNGWQYGTTRDDNRKIHPCLIPYEQLPENEKDKDRTNITDLQEIFSSQAQKTGEKVRKAITIALLASGESTLNKTEILKILKQYKDYHITLISSLQSPQEREFVEIGLKQGTKLIIVGSYRSEKAEWIIDLLPAGKQPISLTAEEQEIQQQRAVIYQLERAEVLIMIGENQQWIKWRQGTETIPAELSSIPASLSREIPNKLIMET